MGIRVFEALKKVLSGSKAEELLSDAPHSGDAQLAPASSAPRIRDRYPEVLKIAVNLSTRAPFEKMEPTIRGFSMGPDALADFTFRCKNTECIDGGFKLTDEIEEMVQSYETNKHGRRVCQGWDGKGNIGHQRCYYELNFVINISYSIKTAPNA